MNAGLLKPRVCRHALGRCSMQRLAILPMRQMVRQRFEQGHPGAIRKQMDGITPLHQCRRCPVAAGRCDHQGQLNGFAHLPGERAVFSPTGPAPLGLIRPPPNEANGSQH